VSSTIGGAFGSGRPTMTPRDLSAIMRA
jgi:hypothetical protein